MARGTLAYRQTLGLTASYPVSSCDSPVVEDLEGCPFLPCHTAASPVWWHPAEGWRGGQAVSDATGASQLILYCPSPKPTSFRGLLQRILDVVRMVSLTPIPTTASWKPSLCGALDWSNYFWCNLLTASMYEALLEFSFSWKCSI